MPGVMPGVMASVMRDFVLTGFRGWILRTPHRVSSKLPRMRILTLVFGLLVALAAAPAHASPDLACNQKPDDRFFWVERAFCDLEMLGPERAQGVIVWNHGIHGTSESWKYPVPPVMRLLQVRGWDVLMLKRHNLAEALTGTVERTVKRTLAEVATQRKAGYKKVVLAGQSFGGFVTLQAMDELPSVDAAIAFAPGFRSAKADSALDPTLVERFLSRARMSRVALVFPRDDALFGSIVRGERARSILATREVPWLMVDETAPDVSGHGGALTGRFALRYGPCLVDFLSARTPRSGAFTCQPGGDDPRIVREVLLSPGTPAPKFAVNPDGVPPELRPLLGPRWALVGDTLALVAPVEERGTVRLMYRTQPTGGIYDASIGDGTIRAVLRNNAVVFVSPENDGTVTWISPDRSKTLKGALRRLDD